MIIFRQAASLPRLAAAQDLLLRMANAGAFESKGTNFHCIMGPDVKFLTSAGYLKRTAGQRDDFYTLTQKSLQALLLPVCLISPKKICDFRRNDVGPDKMTLIEMLFHLERDGWVPKSKPARAIVAPKTKKSSKIMYIEESRSPFKSYLRALMECKRFPEVHHFQTDGCPGCVPAHACIHIHIDAYVLICVYIYIYII